MNGTAIINRLQNSFKIKDNNLYRSSYYWNFRTSSFKQVACLILHHVPVYVTDFPVVNVHVDQLSSARIRMASLVSCCARIVNQNEWPTLLHDRADVTSRYKYGSILWLEDGNLYSSSFKQVACLILHHVPVYVTDFPVVNVHVDQLSSARIWQHKLCVTYSANININNRLPIKVYYRICTLRHIRIGWRILVFYPEPEARDKIY
jgi:hypothetical protein